MAKARHVRFWDRIADRYAARPIKDLAAYEAMLADAAGRLSPTDRVLEIGCGTGSTAIRLAPHVAEWTATDFSPEMLRIARAKPAPENLRFVLADAGSAFDGGPFDAICAFQVLHLVDDLPGTLAGIHAKLKPGGLMIAKTWCFADMGLKLRSLFLVPARARHVSVRQGADEDRAAPGHPRRRLRDRGRARLRHEPPRPLHRRPQAQPS